MLLCPYCIHIIFFVGLWWYGLANKNTLDTPIPSLSTVAQIWAQESGLLPGRCRVCWAAIVVIDGPGHVDMSILYPYKVFCNLAVLWTRLVHPLHNHSLSVCPILAKSGLYCRESGDYIRRQWWSKMVRVMLPCPWCIYITFFVSVWWYGLADNSLHVPNPPLSTVA